MSKTSVGVAEHKTIIGIIFQKRKRMRECIKSLMCFFNFSSLALMMMSSLRITYDHTAHTWGRDGLAHDIIRVDLKGFKDKLFIDTDQPEKRYCKVQKAWWIPKKGMSCHKCLHWFQTLHGKISIYLGQSTFLWQCWSVLLP